MNKEDGPNSKWTKTVDVRQLGNLPSSPEMQNKVAEITQNFPTPRLLIDDGNQDVADLHAREDLLLDELQLGRSVKGHGQDSHRARDAVDRAARIAGGAGCDTPAAMTGDSGANRHHAADRRICAHRVMSRKRRRQKREAEQQHN